MVLIYKCTVSSMVEVRMNSCWRALLAAVLELLGGPVASTCVGGNPEHVGRFEVRGGWDPSGNSVPLASAPPSSGNGGRARAVCR